MIKELIALLLLNAQAQSPAVGEAKKDEPVVFQGTADPSSSLVQSPETLTYDMGIGRDPFARPQPAEAAAINVDSLEGVYLPDGVQVIAIAYDTKNPRALVLRTNDKKPYTVYVGTRMGIAGGVVEAITEDAVFVRQENEIDGRKISERITLTFKKYESYK